jgi:hypothetical protein
MSQETYSGKSFNADKLPACFGAIQALYPEAKVSASVGSTSKEGNDALQLLRIRPDTFSRVDFAVEDVTGSTLTVELREVWDLFRVNVTG